VKSLYLSTLMLLGSAIAVGTATAQPQRPGGGTSALLSAKSVQEELKLSEDDAKKISGEIGKIGRDVEPAERGEKVREILAENLKPEQVKRLNQISWQRSGVAAALNHPDVQAALKLDETQSAKVKELREEFQKQQRELGQSAENRDKVQALRKKLGDDITNVLTADQNTRWTELLGVEFKGEIGQARSPSNDKK
jgi:hypothetical protein